ncbi:MAG: hypothetical protein RBT80_27780 [Candidatus Vecturithrix sp.]|jgi:hypothetical protein|nr:hypothetical protein [Candidatus Vecturithrix sp.]
MAYYVTVNIESQGTTTYTVSPDGTLTPDGTSAMGHMWYSLTDSDAGNTSNYGYTSNPNAPISERLHGPGQVVKYDDKAYASDPAYYRTIEITKEQYDAMKKFGDDVDAGNNPKYDTYDARYNNCIDFVYDALTTGGLNPKGVEGNWIPMGNAWKIDFLLCGKFPINGNGQCAANYDLATQRMASPIVFDLEGDGIETVGMVRQYAATPGGTFTPSGDDPILFDHNGDGVKTNTGWIGSDDGILVMDRNGNGIIDNGRELFGNFTPLYGGGTAVDGFAALSQEDTNQDGVVNSLDANWCRPLKSIHMLRCAAVLGVATYTKSTSHVCGFARLASERI